jgi:protein-disulfide isomerase
MRHWKKSLWLLLIVSLFFKGEACRGEELSGLPWKQLPRVTALEENQRTLLFEVIGNIENYGKCKGTVFTCLTAEKPDKSAVRVTNFGAYVLSLGASQKDLFAILQERATFGRGRNTSAFEDENTPIYGNPKARITITEFAEFKCQYCANLVPVLKKLVEESNGSVRLLFKHFPLKRHLGSVVSSRAAVAAQKQGKFWEMYDLLYKNMQRQGMEDLMAYAGQLGLDMDRFKQDLNNTHLLQIIERDKIEGVNARVPGTPTLFINGKFCDLNYNEPFMKDVINEEAERLGISPPYGDWVY